MYKITFKLRTAAQNKKTGEAPVSVVYRYDGTEALKATGVSCKPKDFDTSKGRVKSSDSFSADKNGRIGIVAARMEKAVQALREAGILLKAAHVIKTYEGLVREEEFEKTELVAPLRDMVNTGIDFHKARIAELEFELAAEQNKLYLLLTEGNRIAGQPEGIDATVVLDLFTDRITEFLARRRTTYTPATKRLYENVGDLVKEWNPRLDITEVNLKVLNSFQNWLVEVKGRKNGTVNTYITKFKAVLSEFADELGINLAFYKKFKPQPDLANKNTIILAPEEIQEIEAMDVSRWEVMSAVRDQFVFCHETGIRHSDLNKVRADAVEDMPAGDGRLVGKKRLRIVTQKGKKQIIVPLTDKAYDILARHNFTFHFYNLRNFNQALESIARRCKTLQYDFTRTHYVGSVGKPQTKPKWEFVQSHAGRRSFINNALLLGVSIETVATWVGHADVKQIRESYAHLHMLADAQAHKLFLPQRQQSTIPSGILAELQPK